MSCTKIEQHNKISCILYSVVSGAAVCTKVPMLRPLFQKTSLKSSPVEHHTMLGDTPSRGVDAAAFGLKKTAQNYSLVDEVCPVSINSSGKTNMNI